GCHELVQVIGKKLDIFAGAVFQDKRHTTSSADAGDGRWRKTEGRALRHLLKFLVQTCLDGLKLFAPALALIPGFQRYPEERVIGSSDIAEQTEIDDACRVLNSRSICENLFHLFCGCTCPLQRRRLRQLHVDIEVALVFVGQEAGGQMFAKEPCCTAGHYKQHHHHAGLANQVSRETDEAVGRALKVCVEHAEEFSQWSASLLLGFEQQCRKCGA